MTIKYNSVNSTNNNHVKVNVIVERIYKTIVDRR